MQYIVSIFLFLFVGHNESFASLEKDRNNILGMAGCYEVRFQFAETFPVEKGYTIKAPYFAGGLEYVDIDVDTQDRIELQHILIVGPNDVIKHWRQEWIYENPERFLYKGDAVWEKASYPSEEVANSWEQNVLQVDDSPRYECSAQWVYEAKSSYWECTSWNPLPRREFTKRKDYNVLKRRNRHELTSEGWVHEQDNEKIVAAKGQLVKILTEEKGKNIYKKVDDSRCSIAKTWWQERRSIWEAVRSAWDDVYAVNSVLKFKEAESPLWEELEKITEQAYKEKWAADRIKSTAKAKMNAHLNQ